MGVSNDKRFGFSGPMVAYLNKKITVVGITSWGIGCANSTSPGYQTISTKNTFWNVYFPLPVLNYEIFVVSTLNYFENLSNLEFYWMKYSSWEGFGM